VAVDEDASPEELGDRVRVSLGARSSRVESVEVLSETLYGDLPAAAAARLGISLGQKNALLRVVLRDQERGLTHEEANELRGEIYAAIHRGTVWHWASGSKRDR
jgi:phenylalanyl-tRNA synthetase alpha chain